MISGGIPSSSEEPRSPAGSSWTGSRRLPIDVSIFILLIESRFKATPLTMLRWEYGVVSMDIRSNSGSLGGLLSFFICDACIKFDSFVADSLIEVGACPVLLPAFEVGFPDMG